MNIAAPRRTSNCLYNQSQAINSRPPVGVEIEFIICNKLGIGYPTAQRLHQLVPDKLKPNVRKEYDWRKFEVASDCTATYSELEKQLLNLRMWVRDTLRGQEFPKLDLTIHPGSKLALGSQPTVINGGLDPTIENYEIKKQRLETFAPHFVTGSIHFHLGNFSNPNEVIRVNNLMRLEAALVLALSSSSPFYMGENTGLESHRWANLPQRPSSENVPFWPNHESYVQWINQKKQQKVLIDINGNPSDRVFWTSVRPHGPNRPNGINHIELRISDLISDWSHFRGILGWSALRTQAFANENELQVNEALATEIGLARICAENEMRAAQYGLDAIFMDYDPRTNEIKKTTVRKAIEERLDSMKKETQYFGFEGEIEGIQEILKNGNEAQKILTLLNGNGSLENTLQKWIADFELQDFTALTDLKKQLIYL